MTLYQDLSNAGLPVKAVDEATRMVEWTRSLNEDEILAYIGIVSPSLLVEMNIKRAAKPLMQSIPNWATWTPEEFATWCDNNLMTDAQIDATTLSAALKANIKANNAFARNAGKMLIAIRNELWPDLPD